MDALQKLGIDGWSVLLYLVNFGALLLLLQRFVFKPLLAFLTKRQEEIATNIHAAETMKQAMDLERKEEEASRLQRDRLAEEQIHAVTQLARDEAKKIVSDAEAQRDTLLSRARISADETIDGAMSEAQALMLQRIETVVLQVLQDVASEKVVKESVKNSWSSITRTSDV